MLRHGPRRPNPRVVAEMGEAEPKPFLVPCRRLPLDAPLRWLRAGWQDLRRAPGLSLLYGLAIFALSVLVSALAWMLGRFALLAALLSGFVFIAPLLAVGLYSISRDLQQGLRPSLVRSLRLMRRVLGQAAVFALLMLVLLLVWSRAGMMVQAFFPLEPGNVLVLVEFLAVGSVVGAIFATLCFAAAVFSLPLIAQREVDMVTAVVSSIHAVLQNKQTMTLWAMLIAALTALGLATAYLGLVVVMPWLAYSAWHALEDALDASAWPLLPAD